MNTNNSSGASDAYIVNVVKQYQINGVPLGTADLVNTANFTRADEVQSDWLQTDSNAARYIRNKPLLATVATSGSAADLSKGVLPLSTIPQLPAPTVSSGNFQIGSFAVDVVPTVDSQQNLGRAGSSWNNVVTRNIAVNKTSANTALDLVGQGTLTGSTLPQLSLVNPSGTADGSQPAEVTFDCTAQGSGQLGSVGFATTRGLFAQIGGVDRLNVSVAGDTSISGSLTGANTAAHRLGNLLISDFGKSTSTVQFAGIGNAVAATPTAALLMPADGSVRINTAGNASVSFQNRYSTNVTVDSTGNVYPATTNAQYLGLTSLAWGTVNTANLNCTSTMNYQGKALQPIATSGSASDLITGIAPLARIPNLPAGQITYGNYTVGSFAVEVDPSVDFSYNLGNTTTRWKDINAYSLDIKGYTSGGTNLGLNCAGLVTVTSGANVIVHDQTAATNAGNATVKADVFQSYYDPSAHTLGTSYTGCSDGYTTTTALWRHKDVGSVATANAASDISTVYALKQSNVGVTTLNAATSQSVNLGIANVDQVVLTSGVLRPATNSALDLGSTSYYYRNLYATTGTIGGALSVGNGTTQTGLINWPSSGTSSGLTWGAGPYSRIVDDGDLRIGTDDNMHFYTGLSGSSNGTERLTLSAAGVTCQSALICNGTASVVGTLTAPSINLPQSSGFTGYTSQLNNNAGFINNANGVTIGGGSFSVNLGRPASAATLDVGGGGNFNGSLSCAGSMYVNGTTSYNGTGQHGFLTGSGSGNNAAALNGLNLSLYCAGSIVASNQINCYSDVRAKQEIRRHSPQEALQKIAALSGCSYKWIDYTHNGSRDCIGLLAQEVEQVCPEAVSQHVDFVPDVYCRAYVTTRDEVQVFLTLPPEKEGTLSTGDRVRLYVDDGTTKVETEIINGCYDGFWVDSKVVPKTDKQVFVWGREVEDARTVSYNQIFTLNVGATQALKRQVDEQQETIQELLKKVEYLYWSKADIAV
jgi:hypothetical protein